MGLIKGIHHVALKCCGEKEYQETGYEVFIGPKNIEIASEPAFPARIAFCRGPLGEEIEFFQEKE